MQSEWDIIKSIRDRVGIRPPSGTPIFGIGDDCAVYTISEGRYGLFSTDISIEDIHFDLSYTSFHDAGYRSMSANISDIYAMGGKPVLALVALGLPSGTPLEKTDELYDGLLASALKSSTFIAGGDISRSDKLVISISIYGETSIPVFRNGARPGDYIYVTGEPGLSKLGLELLQGGRGFADYPLSIKKHLTPDPQNKLMNTVLEEFSPTSMIDISDGLISDLGHICSESGTGFILDADSLPAPAELLRFLSNDRSRIPGYSLYSGEEYELLFTSSRSESCHEQIRLIGKITESGYILKTVSGSENLEIAGYDHFR